MNTLELIKPFSAGLLTVATPCILPLLPIYISIITRSDRTRFQSFLGTLFFSIGFSAVFVLLGLGAGSIGGWLNEQRALLLIIGGAIIVVFGFLHLGIVSIPVLEKQYTLNRRIDVGGSFGRALLMGVIFALGWTPCAGPIIGAVLTYAASKSADSLTGGLYLLAFSAGVGLPFLVLSLFYDQLKHRIKSLNRALPLLQKAAGLLLILLGAALIRAAGPLAGALDQFKALSLVDASGSLIEPPLGHPTLEPRVVMFKSPNCHVCVAMQSTLEQLEMDCRGKQVQIIEIDLSKPENQEARRRFRIQAYPTLALLSKSGAEELRIVGRASIEDLRRAVSVLIGSECFGEQATKTDMLEYMFSERCAGEVLSCEAGQ